MTSRLKIHKTTANVAACPGFEWVLCWQCLRPESQCTSRWDKVTCKLCLRRKPKRKHDKSASD